MKSFASKVGLGLALFTLAGEAGAAARTPTCITVDAPASVRDGLEKLVRSELDAHPTHVAVTDACDTQLSVELVTVKGQGTWLTGRIDGQVPQRETVGGDGLDAAVERLLSVLLHNDPIRLRGPAEASWLKDKSRELARGHLVFEAALAQSALWLGPRLQLLPGGAIGARREGDTLQIGGRILGTWATQETAAELHADYRFALELDAMFWSSREATTAVFGGPVVGWEIERFEGPATLLEPGTQADVIHHGPFVALRGGVELMREADARVFLALQVAFPVLPARDIDQGVVDHWAPSATLSAGLGF